MMKTALIDLDGTILKHSTQEPLEGAIEFLKTLEEAGVKIIFITRRGNEEWGEDDKKYSESVTKKTVDGFGIKYETILFNCKSPRALIDDENPIAIPRETNQLWMTTKP